MCNAGCSVVLYRNVCVVKTAHTDINGVDKIKETPICLLALFVLAQLCAVVGLKNT